MYETMHTSGECSRTFLTAICIDWMCRAAKSADANRPAQLHLLWTHCMELRDDSLSLNTFGQHLKSHLFRQSRTSPDALVASGDSGAVTTGHGWFLIYSFAFIYRLFVIERYKIIAHSSHLTSSPSRMKVSIMQLSAVFGSHWWRYIGKCGRLSQPSWLSVAHYNMVILTYLRTYLLIFRRNQSYTRYSPPSRPILHWSLIWLSLYQHNISTTRAYMLSWILLCSCFVINPFSASCSKLVLLKGFSAILVYPIIFNFWHSGTLALRTECQSVRMSEIKNGGLDQYGIV